MNNDGFVIETQDKNVGDMSEASYDLGNYEKWAETLERVRKWPRMPRADHDGVARGDDDHSPRRRTCE